jgi:hypothetical protein
MPGRSRDHPSTHLTITAALPIAVGLVQLGQTLALAEDHGIQDHAIIVGLF